MVCLLVPVSRLEFLAQVPFVDGFTDTFKSLPYLISGSVALTVLVLSLSMSLVSLFCGAGPVCMELWGGILLIIFDLSIQALFNGGNISDSAFGGAGRDFMFLVIGLWLSHLIQNNLVGFLIGLVLIALPIYGWGWQDIVERCNHQCPFLQ